MKKHEPRLHLEYIEESFDGAGNVASVTYKIPERFNFAYDVMDRLALETPARRAMVWTNEAGEARSFTFADMKRESDRAAAVLLGHGVKKGDKVMLVLKRHFEFWPLALACHKIGATAVPGTNQLAVKDLVYRFKAAQIDAVVCTAEGVISDSVDRAEAECGLSLIKFVVKGEKSGWTAYAKAADEAPPFEKAENANENGDIMLLYFTSGTSGMPKMVAHDYLYPLGHIATAKYWHKVDPDGLHLTIAETGWAKSVWGKLYGQWFMESGIFVYDYDRFVPDALLRLFAEHGITTFCAPPTMYRFFIKEDLTKYDLSSLKHVTIAGEALNPEVFEQFKKATGLSLAEGFGQTETTLTVFTPHWVTPRPGSMGVPSPAYSVDIVDAEGRSTVPGVTGEIVLRLENNIHPVGMFIGYHRDAELTGKTVCGDIYHTGDVAWRDEDGFFWYVGRADDVIKSSGYRIGPFEVESVLMEHPAVLECAVTPAPDPVRGAVVKATIVTAPGFAPSEELKLDIQNYVKSQTAPYKYPRIIEFVSELPKTISGKIRRNEIRKADNS